MHIVRHLRNHRPTAVSHGLARAVPERFPNPGNAAQAFVWPANPTQGLKTMRPWQTISPRCWSPNVGRPRLKVALATPLKFSVLELEAFAQTAWKEVKNLSASNPQIENWCAKQKAVLHATSCGTQEHSVALFLLWLEGLAIKAGFLGEDAQVPPFLLPRFEALDKRWTTTRDFLNAFFSRDIPTQGGIPAHYREESGRFSEGLTTYQDPKVAGWGEFALKFGKAWSRYAILRQDKVFPDGLLEGVGRYLPLQDSLWRLGEIQQPKKKSWVPHIDIAAMLYGRAWLLGRIAAAMIDSKTEKLALFLESNFKNLVRRAIDLNDPSYFEGAWKFARRFFKNVDGVVAALKFPERNFPRGYEFLLELRSENSGIDWKEIIESLREALTISALRTKPSPQKGRDLLELVPPLAREWGRVFGWLEERGTSLPPDYDELEQLDPSQKAIMLKILRKRQESLIRRAFYRSPKNPEIQSSILAAAQIAPKLQSLQLWLSGKSQDAPAILSDYASLVPEDRILAESYLSKNLDSLVSIVLSQSGDGIRFAELVSTIAELAKTRRRLLDWLQGKDAHLEETYRDLFSSDSQRRNAAQILENRFPYLAHRVLSHEDPQKRFLEALQHAAKNDKPQPQTRSQKQS